MRLKRPSLKRLALILLTVVPVLAWAVVKPVRVILPEVAGTTCVSSTLCIDDASQVERAQGLYSEALAFVTANIAEVEGAPRVVFCSTQACADSFGLGARSAVTLGTMGTVIGPKAWKAHYARHELIHYVQGKKLGVLPLLAKPSWFVEGMAYGLSEDPRAPLAEPFEGYRKDFLAWQLAVGKAQMWAEASKL